VSVPNDPAIDRLVTSIIVEHHDEWAVTDRRYLSETSMARLRLEHAHRRRPTRPQATRELDTYDHPPPEIHFSTTPRGVIAAVSRSRQGSLVVNRTPVRCRRGDLRLEATPPTHPGRRARGVRIRSIRAHRAVGISPAMTTPPTRWFGFVAAGFALSRALFEYRPAPHDGPEGWSGPCESCDPVESGELVWVADGVDAGDAPVLDGDAHGGVDLPADVEPDGGGPVEPDGLRLEVH
jgi:hypothetical protein